MRKASDYELLMNQILGLGCDESLLPTTGGSSWDDLQDIESHGFRQGPVEHTDDKYFSNRKNKICSNR